jgi:hypothetical protein
MLHNKITSEKKREMFKVNCVQAYCVCMGERQIEIGVRVEVKFMKLLFVNRRGHCINACS